jgi:hypothetical protein
VGSSSSFRFDFSFLLTSTSILSFSPFGELAFPFPSMDDALAGKALSMNGLPVVCAFRVAAAHSNVAPAVSTKHSSCWGKDTCHPLLSGGGRLGRVAIKFSKDAANEEM